jgi:hypothetical protein
MKVVLAFPPNQCNNWNAVSQHFDRLDGYIENGKVIWLGAGLKFYKQIDPDDNGHMGDPRMRARIMGYRVPILDDPGPRRPVVPGFDPRTSLPRANEAAVFERILSQYPDNLSREMHSDRYGYSMQVPEGYVIRRDFKDIMERLKSEMPAEGRRAKVQGLLRLDKSISPLYASTEFLNMGLDQRSSDKTSFAAMLKTRLRWSTIDKNAVEYEQEKLYGDKLFESLVNFLKLKPKALDKQLFEEETARFQAKRQARSEALKMVSLRRGEPGYLHLDAKTQRKMKSLEPKNASALQTIVTMEDEILFALGPVVGYLTRCIMRDKPSSVYVHNGTTFADLQNFIREYAANPAAYWESDLTQQEKGMSGAYVRMVERIFELYSIPDEYIVRYNKLALTTKANGVVLGIMTFSGQPFTWFVNTFGNMARISVKYDIQPGEPSCWTGDDSLAFRPLNNNVGWLEWESIERAVEKVEVYDHRGSFISLIVTKGEVFKSPSLLLRKLKIASSIGMMKEVVHGYSLDWLTVYTLREKLLTILNHEELEDLNVLSNMMFNMRRREKVEPKFAFDKYPMVEHEYTADWTFHHEAVVEDKELFEIVSQAEQFLNEEDL